MMYNDIDIRHLTGVVHAGIKQLGTLRANVVGAELKTIVHELSGHDMDSCLREIFNKIGYLENYIIDVNYIELRPASLPSFMAASDKMKDGIWVQSFYRNDRHTGNTAIVVHIKIMCKVMDELPYDADQLRWIYSVHEGE